MHPTDGSRLRNSGDDDSHRPYTPTLASEGDEEGRIGYGRFARYTPLGLALVILGVLLAIGIYERRPGDGHIAANDLIGKSAPNIAFTTFDGTTIQLADLRGSVVVLNFWAEWCSPCKEEMPAFQAVSTSNDGQVTVLGVAVKNDPGDRAQSFAQSLGISYPVGKDLGGDDPLRGPIELAFAISSEYPQTIFIRPDGTVDAIRLGAMDEPEIRDRIAAAKT